MAATLLAFPDAAPAPTPPTLSLVKPCALCERVAAFRVSHLSTVLVELKELAVRVCFDHLAPVVDAKLADPFSVTEPVVSRYQR